jgi:hypothetical protein
MTSSLLRSRRRCRARPWRRCSPWPGCCRRRCGSCWCCSSCGRCGWCCGSCGCRRCRWCGCRASSAGQIKRADSQSPATGACGGNVLVDVPESRVVTRIGNDCRVVTPAIAARSLRTRPVDDGSFAEGHLSGWIPVVPGGIKDAWKHGRIRGVRGTKAQSYVS